METVIKKYKHNRWLVAKEIYNQYFLNYNIVINANKIAKILNIPYPEVYRHVDYLHNINVIRTVFHLKKVNHKVVIIANNALVDYVENYGRKK